MKPIPENMYKAAQKGFINATDLADYLVGKGLPFRSAYKIVGQLVAHCIDLGTVLDELPIEEYKKFDPNFDTDLYDAISLETCVGKRNSLGGCGEESFERQVKYIEQYLA
jgi:argininosuccinate lyase